MSLETQRMALAKVRELGGMTRWPYNHLVQAGYNVDDVRDCCVNDEDWQQFRLSLKGRPTHIKLHMLREWWDTHYQEDPKRTEIQVGNYLGALRRGHQLDANNVVEKYL